VTSETGVAIAVRDLTFTYPTAAGPLRVLDTVTFDVEGGEVLAERATFGAGKTTLLAVLGGLDRMAPTP
jgi:predicted ABC-type transport system involved in lysophospholipase L1 biosynthesis ATPase subunit